jgi:Metal-dependent amidase/aminoacylase/carboxypeptidase
MTVTTTQAADLSWVDPAVASVNQEVIDLRHTIHQNPELGNMEFKTAALVADRLKALGLEVRTQVGKTGVVGVLKGGLPGPVVALRADMDALPVKELNDLPYASKATGIRLVKPCRSCMPVGMTPIPPCCWAQPGYWPSIGTRWPVRWCSCSSRPKKAPPMWTTRKPIR